jgi:hypothetical protein
MAENNVTRPDTENSILSRMSSTSDATSGSAKRVAPFTFVEAQCEVAVSTVASFSLFNDAAVPADRT